MTHLEVRVEQRDAIRILHLKGFLDAHNHQVFRSAMEECVEERHDKVVVDFEELSYIGSSGIEVVLAHVQTLRDRGGDIVLCSMSPKVYKVFDLLGLPSFFQIRKTFDEALQTF